MGKGEEEGGGGAKSVNSFLEKWGGLGVRLGRV